jgi:hypothetical protein
MGLFRKKKSAGEFLWGLVTEGNTQTTKPRLDLGKIAASVKKIDKKAVGKTAATGSGIAIAIGTAQRISRAEAGKTFEHGKEKDFQK